jgi:hypothetical protein
MAKKQSGRVAGPGKPDFRPRDYAAEYDRRIARALARGLTRSQGRGHPKASERAVSAKRRFKPIPDDRLQRALRVLRQDKSLSAAAKAAHVSPERLRRYARSKRAIKKRGRHWIVSSKLPRRMLIYSRRKALPIIVGDQASASLAGRFMSAVGKFLGQPNIDLLRPFVGKSVTDITGKEHPLETDPNALYRLASAGGESFESVYRIVV